MNPEGILAHSPGVPNPGSQRTRKDSTLKELWPDLSRSITFQRARGCPKPLQSLITGRHTCTQGSETLGFKPQSRWD